MKLAIVVAMAQNRVIGLNNGLPWHLPEDLKHFKRTTMGHPIVMGRKTYESIGRPLPGRTNIVITRQASWHADGVLNAGSLDHALDIAADTEYAEQTQRVMIVGGAQIYEKALPLSEELFITEIHATIEGDAFFPEFDRLQWKEVSREDHPVSATSSCAFSFLHLQKLNHT